MKHNMALIGLIAFVALLFSEPAVFGLGIGIAPNDITINDAVRGTEYARTLTIFNTGETPDNFTLSVQGNASEWISFHDLKDSGTTVKTITIAGNNKQSLIVKITPPLDEAIGTYKATISAKTVPPASSGTENNTVQAVLMANTFVVITLTGEQVVDGVVNTVTVEEDTEPGFPLRIGTSFKNTGNVAITPKISVSILKDGAVISTFAYDGAKVKPEATETIIAEWNTTSADSVGDYLADVVVFLGGNELATESVPFKVLPVGTLTRQGNLTGIVLADEPAVDSAVKINANFLNTGRIDTLAKFSGEVYRDGLRTDALASDEISAGPGKEVQLASYLKITEPGTYRVKGRVVFSGKETNESEISFTVPESKTAGLEMRYAILAVGLLALGSVAYALWRRRR